MQNILDLKLKLEEQAKMSYANQRQELNRQEQKLELLRTDKRRLEEEGRRLRLNRLSPLSMRENATGIEYMDGLIDRQCLAVRREEAKLEDCRQKLEKVVKERKAQEKLREHAFEQFLRDENAAESKVIDELTSYTYGARQLTR